MTTTLIVLAHPDPRSFNGAWADASQQAARDLGHEVLVSDLCAMGFDAVERPQHYSDTDAGASFDPLKVQASKAEQGRLPPDIESEIDKVRRAHRIIFHFPIWWFSPPAVLKGWFDRVLAHGALHDVDHRFDSGRFRGRETLFCVTTGSRAEESAFNGKEGDIQMLLWPAAYTLRYVGFSVLSPVIVNGVHGYHEGTAETALQSRLAVILDRQAALIADWASHPKVPFNRDSDFDETGRLIDGRPSLSPFIRHTQGWDGP